MRGPTEILLAISLGVLAGCTAAPNPGVRGALPDLPLVLNPNERVTSLFAGAINGAEILVVGEEGTILLSRDYAESWSPCSVPVHATLSAISLAGDQQHGWVVGGDSVILATADAGTTWTVQRAGESGAPKLLDVYALDDLHVIAVGMAGCFLETRDGGKTWSRRPLIPEDIRYNRISRGPTGTLYIAGERGLILRSVDRGATWVRLPSPDPSTLSGILPLGARTLLAYGTNMAGVVFRSDDDGETWMPVVVARHKSFVTSRVLADGTILLIGSSGDWRNPKLGNFFRSRDQGHSFQPWTLLTRDQTMPEGYGMNDVLQAPNGTFVILGTDGVTLIRSL